MTTDPVTALRETREQWGDLLAAIERPPVAEWPPRETRSFLDLGAADAERTDRPSVARLPLTLREYPAPINPDALDAAMATERDLFDLADLIAGAVQRPIRAVPLPTTGPGPAAWITDPADTADPDRWHYPSPTSPGSRTFGVHWCACWIESVISSANPLCRALPEVILAEAVQTIARCHARTARALGRDGRTTVLPAPCPWCHGELTARTTSGDPMAAVVTCGTGPTCTAPAPYDGEARRTWRGADLCGLYGALSAARRRATA